MLCPIHRAVVVNGLTARNERLPRAIDVISGQLRISVRS